MQMLVEKHPGLDASALFLNALPLRAPAAQSRATGLPIFNSPVINHLSTATLLTECSSKTVAFALSWASTDKPCHSYILY
jgi:hypothetical protein